MCDGVGAFCFENAMKTAFDSSKCECLPSCEYVEYKVKKDMAKINYDEECHSKDESAFAWGVEFKTKGKTLIPTFSDVSKPYDLLDLVGEKIRFESIEDV